MLTTNIKPRVSVLTPTWNRAGYLEKVWQGLVSQTYLDFEWIVGNDGSTDNTIEVVRELAAKSDFPVSLINASCRVGKSRIDNEMVAVASGDFIIWCDSDDCLLPAALEVLIDAWESIPDDQREDFCGVTALCDTESGVLGNRFYNSKDPIDLEWNELFSKLGSDLVIFTKTELVKGNPFLEVDFLIPESSVWSVIGKRKTRFVQKVLKRVQYEAANCLSFSGVMAYNRGYAHALALSESGDTKPISKAERLRRLVNYLRYCIHGDIGFKQAMGLWSAKPHQILQFLLLLPFSALLALKDQLQGKVRKTHMEFEVAAKRAKFDILRLSK